MKEEKFTDANSTDNSFCRLEWISLAMAAAREYREAGEIVEPDHTYLDALDLVESGPQR